ncbi:hypothetical protein M2323_002960 [Rhodoblastus acidophilus]|nr:hypothetical protein [Rhodoblastus acidophilus]MCW2334022.1 hypothetical protein [Rhodoblastus acidophilus]
MRARFGREARRGLAAGVWRDRRLNQPPRNAIADQQALSEQMSFPRRFWTIFEEIARLAVQLGANPFKRFKANAFHLAGFQQRQVLFGDPDAGGEIARAHLALGEHDVEVDDDRHQTICA